MNTQSSLRDRRMESALSDRKVGSTMRTTIDRKRIYIFLAIAYGFSIVLALVIYFSGGIFGKSVWSLTPLAVTLMSVLMLAPTIAHIATRLITREGWSNMLLRPKFGRGWSYYLAALFLPALAAIVGGAVYYLLFPNRFDPSMAYARETLGFVPPAGARDVWTFLITVTPLAIAMSILNLPRVFGEEFGWRAYLLPKLLPLGARKASLWIGAIWAVWHWPYVFMGYEYGFGYWGAPVMGPLLWVVICSFLSIFLTWVTLRSGSVWPAALGHGVINATASLMLFFVRGEPQSLIGPMPVGIIGSLGYAAMAVLIFFSARALVQRAPAPVDMALAGNPGALGKTADQAKLGTAS
jgi:membrane protease YdiL (CAAX protease family)